MVVIELGEAAASHALARVFCVGLSRVPTRTSNCCKETRVEARRGGGRKALGAIERAGSSPDRHGPTVQENLDRGSPWR